jgi:hypothetical protein
MSEDVAVAVETPQPQPTIAESYLERTSDASGIAESSKRKPRAAAPEPEERGAHLAKTEPKQSLSDAFDGAAAPEAETFELPAEFTPYDGDAIEAILGLMGLVEEDLRDPEQAALVLAELEEAFPLEEGEEAADEEEANETEPEEKEKTEEKKVEPRPSKLAELTKDQRAEMSKHVEQVWNRAQQVNDPIYSEHFTAALAGALGTPPEGMGALQNTVEILQFGAQNMLESALPAMVNAYLQQNFKDVIENYAPGFSASYTERTLTDTWDRVRGNDLPEFSADPQSEFQKLAEAVTAKHPFLQDIDFKDSRGNPLPVLDALLAKATLTAKLIRGEKVTPATIQDAIAKDREKAAKSNRRVSASRSLGKGRSAGNSFTAEESTTTLRDAYRGHANSDMEGIS